MKAYKKFLSYLNLAQVVYVVVIIFCLQMGSIISTKMSLQLLHRNMTSYFLKYWNMPVRIAHYNMSHREVFQIEAGDHIAYIIPFRTSIAQHRIYGWDIFDGQGQYQDYRLLSWEEHKAWLSCLNQWEVRRSVVEHENGKASSEALFVPPDWLFQAVKGGGLLQYDILSFVEDRLNHAVEIEARLSIKGIQEEH